MVIGGDFNIKIGELRGKEEAGGIKRRNRDKKIGNRERKRICGRNAGKGFRNLK